MPEEKENEKSHVEQLKKWVAYVSDPKAPFERGREEVTMLNA